MILLILVLLIAPQAQVNTEKLKQQAQQLSDAVVKGDFAGATDLTYPKLVRLLGGRAKFIAHFKKSINELQSDRFRLSEIAVGEPRDIVRVGREYYAIVPSKMRFKVAEGMLVGEAFMIGISTDGGQNWTFIDSGAGSDKTVLEALFGPEAASKLRIPETKRPVLHSEP